MKQSLVLVAFLLVSSSGWAQLTDSAYHEEAISLNTSTGTIYGTLATPPGKHKHPVALIIAGSGPTDRDGNNTMMKNDGLRMLAHELAKRNIATVRYDKRGIAASAAALKDEREIRFGDYIEDASTWVSMLRKSGKYSSVSVIGHSEGSLIALSLTVPPDKLISIAGAGFPADSILKKQLEAQPPLVKKAAYEIIDSLRAGKMVDSVPPYLRSLFRPSVQPYMISWFQRDPSALISKLRIPVLLVQGNADLQVTVNDARQLQVAQPAATLVIIDSMNHVLKISSLDRKENLKTYFDPAIPVSKELVDVISDFITRKKSP